MYMGNPEDVDFNDPLSILMTCEAGETGEAEVDVLHSMYIAGTHRAKSTEVERTRHEAEPVTHRYWVEH